MRARSIRPGRLSQLRRTGPKASFGLTLLEMLVALTIVSSVVALLWQALAQVARVERLLEAGTLSGQRATVQVEWLRHLVESLVPLAETEEDTFRGDKSSMSGLSTEVPGWPATFAAPVVLQLQHEPRTRAGRLVLRVGRMQAAGSELTPLLMIEWEGGPGKMQFQAADGRWHDRWPATELQPGDRRLPMAVAIQTGSPEWPVIVLSPRNSGIPRPTRRMMESL